MTWTAIKAAALDALLRWIAKNVWTLAQNMVQIVSGHDDLSGEDKFKLAKKMLLAQMQEMKLEASNSGLNWILESAVQYYKYKSLK